MLREKLEVASVPVNQTDWHEFEPELDELDFDLALRDKLETADLAGEEAGWALLASQLGEDFDRVMAQKLGEAEISGESEWPVLEDQLEAPTEAVLVNKINRFSFPYHKDAWKDVSARPQSCHAGKRLPLEDCCCFGHPVACTWHSGLFHFER
ncbi:MAG: hypothetical protein R3B47_01405 [Bacteroidia bacterium]